MEESKTSVQGRVIRDLIAHFASDNLIGRKLKTGELRKKMVEPAWKCPDCFLMQKIKMPQFEMELLTSMQNPREDKVVLQLHGGGYIGGSTLVLQNQCRFLAEQSGATVISIDYRLAPEAPFPAAFDDCKDVVKWLVHHADYWNIDPNNPVSYTHLTLPTIA